MWRVRGENAYGILVGKPEGNRPFGGPGRRWKNITRYLKNEMVWCGLDVSGSEQEKKKRLIFLNAVMNLPVS